LAASLMPPSTQGNAGHEKKDRSRSRHGVSSR
jgi:hypothetical protein